MRRLTQVKKRDGRIVPFDSRLVADAIYRAAQTVGGEDRFLAEELAGVVGLYLERSHVDRIPRTDDVEDAVERVLVDTGHARTAKAFILHRDRRAAARKALVVEDEGLGERPGPLVGSDAKGTVSAWNPSRVADALVAEAGLDSAEASEVARAVEDRVLASGLPRVPSSLVRSLVDAELFARGHVRSRERQRVVGIPKRDLAERIEAGLVDRRGGDPQAFSEALGEEVLAPYVLEEVVSSAAAEAHRLGEIHLQDLGAPFSMTAVSPSIEALIARALRGESTPRAGGARRFTAALGEALLRHGGAAARVFALEALNVHMAPFVDRLDDDTLHAEARELILSSGLQSFPRRGGLLRLEISLAAEIPERLATRPVPPPAPPGRTYGDDGDAALRVARALLAAAAEVRREGGLDRLPAFVVTVPRGRPLDAAARALVREALAEAAWTGEPVIAFDEVGLPSRGSRALRVAPSEVADPFRFEGGDVSVATTGALNLVSAALLAGPGGTEAFFAEVDRRVGLLLDAARGRRDLLARRVGRPEGTFWAVEHLGLALLDLEGAFHVVETVGADRAAGILLPSAALEERHALRTKIVRYVQARTAEEATARGLLAAVVEPGSPEAPRRLAEVDAARFQAARRWWGEGVDPGYLASRAAGSGPAKEPAWPGRGRMTDPCERVRYRVDADHPPALDLLYEAFTKAAADPSIAEFVVDPWPRRRTHGRAGDLGRA